MKSVIHLLAVLFCLGAYPSFAQTTDFKNAEQAANEGVPEAQAYIGIAYYRGDGIAQDKGQAVKWLTKAAEQGNTMAAVFLANCYFYGDGVEKDSDKGMEWLRKAADQGDPAAQYTLGSIFEGAIRDLIPVLPVDKTEAAKWYDLSAAQGLKEAQANLGAMYARGDGVPKDYVQAYKWSSLAAEQGDAMAIKNVNRLEQLMTKDQIANAKAMADEIRHHH